MSAGAPGGARTGLRLHAALPAGALAAGAEIDLPAATVAHAQVRRMQPGDAVILFDGRGSDWPATVLAMGRASMRVRLGAPVAVHAELPIAVTLAFVMPANQRVDALVEKATELGAATLQPLHGERSVLRLAPDRAEARRAHWQAVAAAACEQCGRARVPQVAPVRELGAWLASEDATASGATAWLLDTDPGATPVREAARALARGSALRCLSGPEGGLAPAEGDAAREAGFVPVSLGPRVLRADTAPLALLAWLGVEFDRA